MGDCIALYCVHVRDMLCTLYSWVHVWHTALCFSVPMPWRIRHGCLNWTILPALERFPVEHRRRFQRLARRRGLPWRHAGVWRAVAEGTQARFVRLLTPLQSNVAQERASGTNDLPSWCPLFWRRGNTQFHVPRRGERQPRGPSDVPGRRWGTAHPRTQWPKQQHWGARPSHRSGVTFTPTQEKSSFTAGGSFVVAQELSKSRGSGSDCYPGRGWCKCLQAQEEYGHYSGHASSGVLLRESQQWSPHASSAVWRRKSLWLFASCKCESLSQRERLLRIFFLQVHVERLFQRPTR